jgi:hypothetical protein
MAPISKTSQPIAGDHLTEDLGITTDPIHIVLVGYAWPNLEYGNESDPGLGITPGAETI